MIKQEVIVGTIGKSFADKLDEVIIDVGPKITFTRREMVEKLGCANFLAAYRLQKVLKRLKISTPNQLARLDPFSLVRSKGIGEAAMFVAMCILDINGYDPVKWWVGDNNNFLKFSSFKKNAIRRASKRKQEVN